MTFEVELKARLKEPVEIEQRAAKLGEFKRETSQEDVYFRRRGDSNRLPAERYRLRREGEQAVVTFKRPVEAGGLEVNQEVEFGVEDAHAFFQFADRFRNKRNDFKYIPDNSIIGLGKNRCIRVFVYGDNHP